VDLSFSERNVFWKLGGSHRRLRRYREAMKAALAEDEVVLSAAEATSGNKGLLLVTDRRVAFLMPKQDKLWQAEFPMVERAEAKDLNLRLFGSGLPGVGEKGSLLFALFLAMPVNRAEEIGELLSSEAAREKAAIDPLYKRPVLAAYHGGSRGSMSLYEDPPCLDATVGPSEAERTSDADSAQGTAVSAQAPVCPNCGNPATGYRFCPVCGTGLASSELPARDEWESGRKSAQRAARERAETVRLLVGAAAVVLWLPAVAGISFFAWLFSLEPVDQWESSWSGLIVVGISFVAMWCLWWAWDTWPQDHSGPAYYQRQAVSQAVKSAVFARDEGRCVYCGSAHELEFDHVIPVSRGGSSGVENVQVLCRSCNRRKSARI